VGFSSFLKTGDSPMFTRTLTYFAGMLFLASCASAANGEFNGMPIEYPCRDWQYFEKEGFVAKTIRKHPCLELFSTYDYKKGLGTINADKGGRSNSLGMYDGKSGIIIGFTQILRTKAVGGIKRVVIAETKYQKGRRWLINIDNRIVAVPKYNVTCNFAEMPTHSFGTPGDDVDLTTILEQINQAPMDHGRRLQERLDQSEKWFSSRQESSRAQCKKNRT